jgi:hypothetical protein
MRKWLCQGSIFNRIDTQADSGSDSYTYANVNNSTHLDDYNNTDTNANTYACVGTEWKHSD